MPPTRLLAATLVVLTLLLGALAAPAAAASGKKSYIVVLKSGGSGPAAAAREARKGGASVEHVYKHTIKGYAAKAGAYRQEAAAHRKMFADYESSGSNFAIQSKMGRELPWVAKMRNHCDSYVKEAERLAAEADRFAEFHRMRGSEMQGK